MDGTGKGASNLTGKVSFVSLLFQSITHMGPGFSVLLAIPAAAAFAGGSLDLSVVIAGIAMLFMAGTVRELAKKLPSAGGFYTYGTNALGPRVGFIIGWCVILAENITPALGLWGSAFSIQGILALFNVHTPFWPWVILVSIAVYIMMYRGVEISMRSGVFLGVIEMLIFVVLAVLFIAEGHVGGSMASLTPRFAVHGWSGVFVGMIWVIFAFIGFEAVVPMAEEAKQPKVGPQRVLIFAPIIVGLFYLFTSYGATVAMGVVHMGGYNADSWVNLTGKTSKILEALMLFAVLNSSVAVVNSSALAVTRVMYAMGRDRNFPAAFSQVHPNFGTPSYAIVFQGVFSVLFTLLIGWWQGGPLNAIGWDGEIITLLVIIAYYIFGGGVSTIVLYSKRFHAERKVVQHIVVPAIAILLMLLPLYASVVPFPPYPLNLAPIIVVMWILAGTIMAIKKQFPVTAVEIMEAEGINK